ncbi:MAG TPA: CHASE3 domain-containing protein [Pyrinomonadaceae bacterium]|jgi:methyl-accepting chemotaxis protein|nr:CHASE3 domain-containing protein [Pyrinomonadaceae bacterium]
MKWSVGTKITAGFSVALIVFVIVGMISYRSTTQLIGASDQRKHTYDVLGLLDDALSSLQDVETGQRGYLLVGDDSYLEPYQAGSDKLDQRLQEIKRLTVDNPRQQQRIDRLSTLVKERLASARETIELRRRGKADEALQIIKTGKDKSLMDEVRKAVSEIKNEEVELLAQRTEEARVNGSMTKWTIGIGTLVALSFAGLAGFVITRNIARPLRDLTTVAERITVGDLNLVVSTDGRSDEVGVLARTFDRMTQSLRTMATAAEKIANGDLRSTIEPQSPNDVLGNAFARMSDNLREQIRGLIEGANILGSAASEIVASTSQLASTATESATAVNETTTTVEEVRQTAELASQKAKYVADSAQKAAQTSVSGRKSAEDVALGMNRIRQQMEAIAESMVRLSEQSQTIGQIIATVEDLASQSNLLAVNAAIEAAKAGEHGKGFGVVAQEVKSLAEQSRQATNQVRTILSDIQKATTAAVMATEQGSKAVEAGERQTGSAGEAIQTLAANVSEAAQAATQIAASSQQQLVGTEQVAAAMESIKQASTQNVASAKQLESAARNVDDLGQRLKQIVAGYKA